MKFNFAAVATALGATALLASPAMAQKSPAKKAERRIAKMDANGDKNVDMAEFTAWRTEWAAEKGKDKKVLRPKALERAFEKFDSDGNGMITAAEIEAMIEAR